MNCNFDKTYCFFSARYLPYLGGVERYTYNLAKELTANGNKVIIVTSLIGNEAIYEEKEEGTIIRMPSYKVLNGRFPIIKLNKATRRLLNKLKYCHIDAIIINTRFYLLSYVGAKFAKKNRIDAIVIEHGTGHFSINNKFFDFVGHIYEHIISRLIKDCIYDYFGVSLECTKWLKHFNINANGVLYNAINEKEIYDICQKDNLTVKNMIKYDEHNIIITFAGRLIQEKGVLKLINAFEAVKKRHKNVKLCIAGDGDLYHKLITENYEGVYLLGKLSFKDIISLLKLSEIFCLPTDYPEGLPTSVLEAIACKNFIITTKAGGSKEIILDNTFGIIFDQNNEQELQEKLLFAIENKSIRKSAIEKAYAKVLNEFTWSNTAEKLINFFENTIAKKQAI